MVLAAESCLREARSRVVYGAPTLKHLEEFVLPVMSDISDFAPPDCRPEFNHVKGHWEFPNGSFVHLFGADDERKANRGRGPKARRAIFDEAGFTDVLHYVLKSVFRPSLVYGGGQTILGSTPADTPDHDFTRIAEIAEANGNYTKRTLYDNPLLTKEEISKFIADNARDEGMTVEEYVLSDDFRREYMAERRVDRNLVVMGDDWTSMREVSIVELARPEFFDAYSVLDFGGVDPHAALFGYWHFANSCLVIEDELLLRDGQNTAQLAEMVKSKEISLWGTDSYAGTLRGLPDWEPDFMPDWLRDKIEDKAPAQPYLRVCDNDIQLARDLSTLHGLTFLPTAKDDKRLQVNELRVMLRQGRIKIHPRCKQLDRHLRTTVWSSHHQSGYARKDKEHGDLLDALVYLVRNIRQNKNPMPATHGLRHDEMHIRQLPAHPLSKLRGLRSIR